MSAARAGLATGGGQLPPIRGSAVRGGVADGGPAAGGPAAGGPLYLEDIDGQFAFNVSADWQYLACYSPEGEGYEDLVLLAVVQDVKALELTPTELRADKRFMLKVVFKEGLALQYASDALKGDQDVVKAAVSNNGHAIQHAAIELQEALEVVLIAAARDGGVLEYMPNFQNDRDVVLAAVGEDINALRWASAALKADRDFVLAAVDSDGLVLAHMPNFQNDREVVLSAVAQNGLILEYVSYELRADPAVVLVAVSEDGDAAQYASEELQEYLRKGLVFKPDYFLFRAWTNMQKNPEMHKGSIVTALLCAQKIEKFAQAVKAAGVETCVSEEGYVRVVDPKRQDPRIGTILPFLPPEMWYKIFERMGPLGGAAETEPSV